MMERLLIIKSFVTKAKKQLIIISLMILLASILLNMWLVTLTDYKNNFFNVHDKLNSENVILNYSYIEGVADLDEVNKILEKENSINSFEVSKIKTVYGSCEFGDGIVLAYYSILDKDFSTNKRIGYYEIIQDSDLSGVYLPYVFLANEFYKVGDIFSITLDGKDYSWNVAGFYNSATTGSVNCKEIPLIFASDIFEKVNELFENNSIRVSIRLNDDVNAEEYESKVLNLLSDTKGILLNYSTNYIKLSSNRYTTEAMCAGVISICAIISVITLLCVIAICLYNYIRDNMKNFGALKAVGYISRNLINPIVLLFFIIAVAVSSIGIAISYFAYPLIDGLMAKQVGIPYNLTFLILPSALTLSIVIVTILVTTLLSLLRIKRIEPIVAIRGETVKSKGNNILPLSKSKLGLNSAIALKTTFTGFRKNIVTFLTLTLVSLLIGFSLFCYQYVILNPDTMLNMVTGDNADSRIYISSDQRDTFLEDMETDSRVEKVYYHNEISVGHIGGGQLMANIMDETCMSVNSYMCTDGVFPSENDQVAINVFYANKTGLGIGDNITLAYSTNEYTYKIVGIIQGALYSGRDIVISEEGFNNLSVSNILNYSLRFKDGVDIDEFNSEIGNKYNSLRTINYHSFIKAQSDIYIKVFIILVIAIIILCVSLTVFVLYVLINMLLHNKRKEHGIYKSIGFVTSQIVYQTAASFVPICVPAIALGLMLSKNGVSDFLSFLLRNMGIKDFSCYIDIKYIVIAGIALVLLTFVTSCILSLKIKKITPNKLFTNE